MELEPDSGQKENSSVFDPPPEKAKGCCAIGDPQLVACTFGNIHHFHLNKDLRYRHIQLGNGTFDNIKLARHISDDQAIGAGVFNHLAIRRKSILERLFQASCRSA